MINLVANYIENHKSGLNELYQWEFDTDIPENQFGIKLTGTTWFEKTNELRASLCCLIEQDSAPSNHVKIAKYFIREWGGIRRFSKAEEVVVTFNQWAGTETLPLNFRQSFSSISSWSKWASLICPQWACIYDARVAYSLNAINYINGGRYKIYPTPPGRNSRLTILDVSTLLLASKIEESDNSDPKILRKKHFISNADAYQEYLSLIKGVSIKVWGDNTHIHEVEALLFALADTSIYSDVFSDLQSNNAIKFAS